MANHIKNIIVKLVDSILILLAIDGLSIIFFFAFILIFSIQFHIIAKSTILTLVVVTYLILLSRIDKIKQ